MQTYKKRPDGGSAVPKSPAAQAAIEGNINYQPTQADMGSRTDLPEAMRAKMEAAFGMDFSGVQLYQSQAVADAGANAMAMGNKIAFAPGKLDFSSHSGQALLGHELSHVASQARGEVSGQGFLDNSLLEARADREGAMAAAGESVYAGPVTPLSTTSTAMSAAGPMQAKKKEEEGPIRVINGFDEEEREKLKYGNAVNEINKMQGKNLISEEEAKEREKILSTAGMPEGKERQLWRGKKKKTGSREDANNAYEAMLKGREGFGGRAGSEILDPVSERLRSRIKNIEPGTKMEKIKKAFKKAWRFTDAVGGQAFRAHGFRKSIDQRGWEETNQLEKEAKEYDVEPNWSTGTDEQEPQANGGFGLLAWNDALRSEIEAMENLDD